MVTNAVMPSDRLSLNEWFALPPIQLLTTSETLGWDKVSFQRARMNPTHDFLPTPDTPSDTLIMILAGRNYLQGSAISPPHHGLNTGPGALMLAPHNRHFDARWNATSEAAFLTLSRTIKADTAATVLKTDPGHVELKPTFNFFDPLLRHLFLEIVAESQNSGMLGSLYIESIVHTVSLHLLRHYSNVSQIKAIPDGPLSSTQRLQITDYIHSHLHEKISLTDLAGCLGLSVPHFEKMFRATFHCAPYRYVLECRVEKARLLLSSTQRSVVEIALDCGFANQSHFTRHFTRWVGISPARFAREHRQ